jgi:hypothetical protein
MKNKQGEHKTTLFDLVEKGLLVNQKESNKENNIAA